MTEMREGRRVRKSFSKQGMDTKKQKNVPLSHAGGIPTGTRTQSVFGCIHSGTDVYLHCSVSALPSVGLATG